VSAGETFSIDVRISDVANLTCWEFKLFFNGTVLNCTDAVEGSFLKSGGTTGWEKHVYNNEGRVHLGCYLYGIVPGVNGSGVLASVTFKAVASGRSVAHLNDTELGDCHIPPQDIAHTTSDGVVYVGLSANTPPVASDLAVTPSSPKTTDSLVGSYVYSDADGDAELGSEIRWFENGVLQSAYDDFRMVPASSTTKGEVWYFTVKPKDGTDFGTLQTSPSVTIQNTPPEASNLTITPSSPKLTDNIVGNYNYSDTDGDAENGSEIRWYRDDVLQSAYNDQLLIPSNTTANGQAWYFAVKPRDGEAFGSPKQSPSVTIGRLNNAPVASNLTIFPFAPCPGDSLTAGYDYYDADSDPESGTEVRWYKNGVFQPGFNDKLTVSSNSTNAGETWYFTVVPKDGKDFGALQTSPQATIVERHDVAVIGVVPSKTVVGQGCLLYINVTVANDGGFNESFGVTAYAGANVIGTVTLSLSGHNVTSVAFTWNTTDSDFGKYTISAIASIVPGETNVTDNTCVYGAIIIGIPGDLNCDGKVNILDFVVAVMSFNCKSGDKMWNPNADVNDDGRVNIVDITRLALWYLNFQQDQFTPKTRISVDPSVVEETIGDVGTYFNVTVTIEHVTDLFGFDLNMTWDSTLLTLHACYYRETLNGLWGEGNWFTARNLNGAGWCQLAALSTKNSFNSTDGQDLFILEFRVESLLGSSAKETTIHFEKHKLSNSKSMSITHVVQDGVYRITG
jgi:hypothetical protein